jgi:hypothetical protein
MGNHLMAARFPLQTEQDRSSFNLVATFADGRLDARETVEWALTLSPHSPARQAVQALVERSLLSGMAQPWRTAWGLIEEYWDQPGSRRQNNALGLHQIEQRFRDLELTGSTIASLASYVRPRLELRPLRDRSGPLPPAKKARSIGDILHAEITSETVIDPRRLRIDCIEDSGFLASLARALEVDLDHGLDLGQRLGWDIERDTWRLGLIRRVYFVNRVKPNEEPDRFDKGLTPTIKLLHATVDRLADLEPQIASGIVRAWFLRPFKLYRRLWASLSFRSDVTLASEVEALLLGLNPRDFWDIHGQPELTELRARRFSEFSADAQTAILKRIRRGPAASGWPKDVDAERVEKARRYWRTRELRRLEVGGASLPLPDARWLNRQLKEFPDLRDIELDHDFLDGVQVHWREPAPDKSFDSITGMKRLIALEQAFNAPNTIQTDPGQQAADWMRADQNILAVLRDLEGAPNGGDDFPEVWERFGWAHTPVGRNLTAGDAETEAERVIAVLLRLPTSTTRVAIEGISNWMSSWDEKIEPRIKIAPVWFKIWPIALEATNAQSAPEDNLSFLISEPADREPSDLDTLNTAAGRMVGVFLSVCPDRNKIKRPFDENSTLLEMRDVLDASSGRSALIAKYRMIEAIGYFLGADRKWAERRLVSALSENSEAALVLWRAVGRQNMPGSVVQRLAGQMVTRVQDQRIGRATRNRLLFHLVVAALRSLSTGHRPPVSFASIQQTIRLVEPEVRAHAAKALAQVIAEWPGVRGAPATAEEVFKVAVGPFIAQVWPQERSLAAPSTSREFAPIPASSKGEFANAVSVLQRFLVPFDCWSLMDYGLYRDDDMDEPLKFIDDAQKCRALLELLDQTVGIGEGAVIPYDLGKALQRIALVSPSLSESSQFRRLAAAARM